MQLQKLGALVWGQSCARAPGMEAPDVHKAACRCCQPASQYAQPRAHWGQTRATIWIRENCHCLHCFRCWRQLAFISVNQEQHLCWRFRRSVRTPWSHALGALHQLDHLLKQDTIFPLLGTTQGMFSSFTKFFHWGNLVCMEY